MLSLLVSVLLSATPQEHQVERVLAPQVVTLQRLDRGARNVEIKIRPVEQADRNVTLIVPNDAEGLVKLGGTLKNTERLVQVSPNGPVRKFTVYMVPFADLQDAAKLKELAKDNKTVQMYPTFIDPPFAINGKVLVNVKFLQKDKLQAFVAAHNLLLEAVVENNVFGTYFLQVTDKSDLLDVFEVLKSVEQEDWIHRASLDVPLVPLR